MSDTAKAAAGAQRELGRQFDGELIGPEDAAYGEARALFNAMIDRRPAVIARCASADAVAKAIGFAQSHDCPSRYAAVATTARVSAAWRTALSSISRFFVPYRWCPPGRPFASAAAAIAFLPMGHPAKGGVPGSNQRLPACRQVLSQLS